MKHFLISLTVIFAVNPSYADTSVLAGPIQLVKNQEYKKAANTLYKIIFSSKTDEETKLAARYYFAYSLMKLKLYQTAAFPMIVTASGSKPKIAQKSFEHLVNISESLNDTELLDFTLKQLDANNLSEVAKEFYYNRMAQALMRENKFDEADKYLKMALQLTSENEEALYTTALIKLKQNKTAEGIQALEKIVSKHSDKPITNIKRQTASMALARAYYQAKRWDDATELYREIPKDNLLYRQAQVELSWSLFRAAKFRSAMSSIQTLQTPFYENFYDPESLILRTIILIFVCQPEEAEKTLATFKNIYNPAYTVLSETVNSGETPDFYYSQIDEAMKYLKSIKNEKPIVYKGRIPFFIIRSLFEEPGLKNKLDYLNKIQLEKERIANIFKSNDEAVLRKYALKILDIRIKGARKSAGNILKKDLLAKNQDLALLMGDVNLLNYEILNTKKNQARTDYIKKLNNHSATNSIDQDESRDFYVKNGYRYWPFEGEYWKDEIGNYQYLGVNRCDQE
ncbi:MAG: hypothetical protein ACXVCP_00590 [Bdellovibrio sp.]